VRFSQEDCGNYKPGIYSLYLSLQIHSKPSIWRLYIYKLKNLLLKIENLQNYLVSRIFILFFDFWLNFAKEKKRSFMTLGKEYGMRRGNWEVYGGLGICRNNIKKQSRKHIFVSSFSHH
jgi:hypothetical protein